MSDLDSLQKLIKTQAEQIGALIQAESSKERLKNELASTIRAVEKAQTELRTAHSELEKVKQDASKTISEAQKKAEDIVRDAELLRLEASRAKAESVRLERVAEVRAGEAETFKAQYESALADVTAKQEKLRAALV